MTRIFAVLATATVLAAGTLVAPQTADARCIGCAIGGGVLAGALIGSAIANSAPAPAPVYGYGPGYAEPACFWRRERFWDGYDWHFRRVQICR